MKLMKKMLFMKNSDYAEPTADVDEVVFQIFDSDSDPSDYDEPPVIQRKNTKKKTVVKRQAWDSDEIEEIDKYF